MRGTTTGERIAAALGLRPIDGHDGRVGRPGVRLAAAGFVALTGAVLAVPNAAGFAGAADPVRSGLAVVGTAVSLALVAIGVLLYRSRFGDRNLVRVAGWNLLGLVVLGAVVSLHVVASGLTAAPGTGTFLVGNLLAVGAAAHVIIGFYDAQRVRAGRLASERRKLAVLARVLRHNLRNDATVIRGHAARAADRLDAPAGATDGGVDAASTGGEGPNEPSSGPSAAAVDDARESSRSSSGGRTDSAATPTRPAGSSGRTTARSAGASRSTSRRRPWRSSTPPPTGSPTPTCA
ncbi:hypothetical protein [Halobaculum litoreum]|uniref:hypothetical protein n=1 Tax=Halobaculum litoreum TaxID=3031998 RepID=UPI0024C3D99C|nr:hypothetical protein [Halobaculum sp. DT92]